MVQIGIRSLIVMWFVIALAASLLGATNTPPPGPQVILLSLAALAVISVIRNARLSTLFRAIPTSTIVGFHCTRFVGFYFLYLYDRGRLPYDFAVLGGLGDIIVAFCALVIVWRAKHGTLVGSRGIFLWNTLGLIDILFVVATASRLALTQPGSMHEITHLPLSLLPLFLVPIIISSHLLIFFRLSGRRSV